MLRLIALLILVSTAFSYSDKYGGHPVFETWFRDHQGGIERQHGDDFDAQKFKEEYFPYWLEKEEKCGCSQDDPKLDPDYWKEKNREKKEREAEERRAQEEEERQADKGVRTFEDESEAEEIAAGEKGSQVAQVQLPRSFWRYMRDKEKGCVPSKDDPYVKKLIDDHYKELGKTGIEMLKVVTKGSHQGPPVVGKLTPANTLKPYNASPVDYMKEFMEKAKQQKQKQDVLKAAQDKVKADLEKARKEAARLEAIRKAQAEADRRRRAAEEAARAAASEAERKAQAAAEAAANSKPAQVIKNTGKKAVNAIKKLF